MARHEFEPTRYHNALGTTEPALTIADGDTVVAHTIDAWGIDRNDRQVASRPNPMSGPFFVTGAEPGDTLIVSIDSMTMTRDTGWTYAPLAPNVIDPEAVAAMPARTRHTWTIDREAGTGAAGRAAGGAAATGRCRSPR